MTREQEKPTRAKGRIPAFKTVGEAARFWDTHDSTQFEDQFEDVEDVTFVKAKPKKAITVRLEDDTIAALAREARQKGLGPSTLVRMWILERLNHQEVSQ